MKVWGITLEQAAQIAAEMGLRLERPKLNGRAIQFGIRRASADKYYARLSPFTRRNDGGMRVCGSAVCWHGHRDFMRGVFRVNPDARILTNMADYKCAGDFEDKFGDTAYTNVGSTYRPFFLWDACACGTEQSSYKKGFFIEL